jgi:hypothetical protein
MKRHPDYARAMQDAGASAIELSIYYLPATRALSGRDVQLIIGL